MCQELSFLQQRQFTLLTEHDAARSSYQRSKALPDPTAATSHRADHHRIIVEVTGAHLSLSRG
jgi:hypothetical protein